MAEVDSIQLLCNQVAMYSVVEVCNRAYQSHMYMYIRSEKQTIGKPLHINHLTFMQCVSRHTYKTGVLLLILPGAILHSTARNASPSGVI